MTNLVQHTLKIKCRKHPNYRRRRGRSQTITMDPIRTWSFSHLQFIQKGQTLERDREDLQEPDFQWYPFFSVEILLKPFENNRLVMWTVRHQFSFLSSEFRVDPEYKRTYITSLVPGSGIEFVSLKSVPFFDSRQPNTKKCVAARSIHPALCVLNRYLVVDLGFLVMEFLKEGNCIYCAPKSGIYTLITSGICQCVTGFLCILECENEQVYRDMLDFRIETQMLEGSIVK
jgi:hypothetical protein